MKIFRLNQKQAIILGLFVAISVVLVSFSAFITGGVATAWGNIRGAISGVPIKMAGFFFGPFYGMLTGLIADVLGNMFVPGNYNPGYTINLMIEGMIPGFVAMLIINTKSKKNMNYVWFTTFMAIQIFFMAYYAPQLGDWIQEGFNTSGESSTPTISIGGLNVGQSLVYLFVVQEILIWLVVFIYWMVTSKRKSKYAYWLPVICLFVVIEDLIILFITPVWDHMTFGLPYAYLLGSGLLYFPIKSVFNILIQLVVFYLISKRYDPIANSKVKYSDDAPSKQLKPLTKTIPTAKALEHMRYTILGKSYRGKYVYHMYILSRKQQLQEIVNKAITNENFDSFELIKEEQRLEMMLSSKSQT